MGAGDVMGRWMPRRLWGVVRGPGWVALLGLLACAIALVGSPVSGAAARAATLPPGDTGVVDASGDTGTPQTEQTLAVDPSDPRNVMIGEIGDCLSVSHDGGRTWKLNNVYHNCTADNNPAFDSHGVAYFYIDDGGLFKSTDHGDTFAPGVRIAGNNGGDVPDRPWFVIDQSPGPSNGTQYLSYESFFTNPVGWIYEVSSADGFEEHRVDDMTSYPATQDPRNYPVVGADGTLYIAYAEGHAGFAIPQQPEFPISFVVARSSDHGATFRYAVAAKDITRSSAPTEEGEAISSLAADPSPLRAGHLALAWADQRTGTSRILLTDSVDGGVTWSKPVDVTGDPIATDNQDHVQVRFLPDGRIAMVWRDRRCCGGGFSDRYNLYARTIALSDSGALTPGPVVQVTDSPQQPNSDPALDEYLGFAAGPEGLSVAWNQPRLGVPATYYRRMPLSEFASAPLAPPSGSRVPRPAKFRCPAASGSISARSLGPIRLGESRSRLRRALRRDAGRRAAYTDVFCFVPIGIRVGFLPPAARRHLSPRARRALAGHAVLILTANRHYSLRGVRPGARVAMARRRLRLSRPIRAGLNIWYLASAGRVTGVLKVRAGVVRELGIADRRLTSPRTLATALLSSF
jgi:hypothetical protein